MTDAKRSSREVPLEKIMSADGSECAGDSASNWTVEEEKQLMLVFCHDALGYAAS